VFYDRPRDRGDGESSNVGAPTRFGARGQDHDSSGTPKLGSLRLLRYADRCEQRSSLRIKDLADLVCAGSRKRVEDYTIDACEVVSQARVRRPPKGVPSAGVVFAARVVTRRS